MSLPKHYLMPEQLWLLHRQSPLSCTAASSQTSHLAAVLRCVRGLDRDDTSPLVCLHVHCRSLAHVVPALEVSCNADGFLSICALLLLRQLLDAPVLCLLALLAT